MNPHGSLALMQQSFGDFAKSPIHPAGNARSSARATRCLRAAAPLTPALLSTCTCSASPRQQNWVEMLDGRLGDRKTSQSAQQSQPQKAPILPSIEHDAREAARPSA